MQRYHTALITGASAGIGAEYARQLASQGVNLILVARRQARLDALATGLRQKYPICVEILLADLLKPEDVDRVVSMIKNTPELDILVNNAGFGATREFGDGDIREHLGMLQVHNTTPVLLTHAAISVMVKRHRGWIVNVASVAAFVPYGSVMYPSTKAFLVSFSQALQTQLINTGIRVQALCPGFTYTEFHDVVGMDRNIVPKFAWMPAEHVVAASIKALTRKKVIVVPGWRYKLVVAFSRLPLSAAIVEKIASSSFIRRRIHHD